MIQETVQFSCVKQLNAGDMAEFLTGAGGSVSGVSVAEDIVLIVMNFSGSYS